MYLFVLCSWDDYTVTYSLYQTCDTIRIVKEFTNPNYLLVIAGIIAIVVELLLGVATGFDLLLIGGIFIISGLIGYVTSSFTIALILVAVLSIIYVFVGRQFVKSKL